MDSHREDDPEAFVSTLYRVLLGREPDREGLASHVRALRSSHITRDGLTREFVKAAEFLRRHGLSRIESGQSPIDAQVTLKAMDCDFVLPPNSDVAIELSSAEGYEPWVLPYFLGFCRPGMTVVDIGASWGVFSLPAARRVAPSGRVFAIEVSPWNCHVLLKSLKASGIENVHVLPLGVSDRLGAELLPRQTWTNNNVVSSGQDADIDRLDGFDIIPTLPMDSFRGSLGPVHIVKMDIEGMEYKTSVGAISFLREQRPLVFLEYSPDFQKRGSGVEGSALIELYLNLGYGVEILHRHAPRERLVATTDSEVITRVDSAWREHVEADGGTHLDLCLHPLPFR